jgi:hypothetical protein
MSSTGIKRMNSFEWRKELSANMPINFTLILPNGKTVQESISKFDMLISTLCAKYGLDPKEHRLKDVNNHEVKFTQATTLADLEGAPYSANAFHNLTLKLKQRTLFNKMIGKGKTVTRRRLKNKRRTLKSAV